MKLILTLFVILARFYIGFKVMQWIALKIYQPELHSISEIELYLVMLIFDTWVVSSHTEIDVSVIKKENQD